MRRSTLSILLFLASFVVLPCNVMAQIWTVIGFDPKADGRNPAMADAALLSYRYDNKQDFLWFRISLYGKADAHAFGVNVAVDTGADAPDKMNWWGANNEFRFDKLITAWVTLRDDGYHGTIGVGDAVGARAKQFNNLQQDNLQIRVEGDSILIGIKRSDLTDKMKMNLIATVGSNESWNDDIPNRQFATIDLAAPRPLRGLREIDSRRNNFQFPPEYVTLKDNRPAVVEKSGNGRTSLILIPGVYSGKQPFDGFVQRNGSKYKFYVLTPPGLNGTPARPLPPESTSYGEFTWTRRLERDILDLIKKEKLVRPVIVAHGFPGSLAAEELATHHPEILSGMIEVASMPVLLFPSPKDPSRKTPAAPDERIEYVNESWAQKWFKYVTSETWESNNYPANMLLSDLERGELRRQEVEAVPLQVKIRYLSEFMASDHSHELLNLPVPLLALRPSFNKTILADPATSWYKTSFLDPWEAFSKNPRIQVVTIPDARALILDDQPEPADEAVRTFLEGMRSAEMHRGRQ